MSVIFRICTKEAFIQKDAKCDPHLPAHDERTSNLGRAAFGSEDWDSRRFGAHPQTQKETANEKLLPCLRTGRADDRTKTKYSRKEDCPTATKLVVQRV